MIKQKPLKEIFMDYRLLGKSGLKVSPLCLGTMTFRGRTDDKEADRIVGDAWENGVNFIDTADIYQAGEAERIVGKLISQARDWWVLATKVGNPMGKAANESGLSRKWVIKSCENSLRRLNTDYIDLYYFHRDYEDVPVEEMVHVMADLTRSGKIRYFALSNFRAWRIAKIITACDELGAPRPVACQPYYNAMNRQPEVEILPACLSFGLGVVPYSPMARGVLTGKYRVGETPSADTRAGHKDKRMMETEFREESIKIAKRITEYAAKKGLAPGQFATAWVLGNKIVDSVIAGPRTLIQWKDYYKALDYKFDHLDEDFVDSLVAPGHPSTPGYNDPQYPLSGRLRN